MGVVEAFADRLLTDMMLQAPDLAAELGVEVHPQPNAEYALPDFSDTGVARRRDVIAKAQANLPLPPPASERESALTFEVVRYFLSNGLFGVYAGVEAHRFPEAAHPLNHFTGAPSALLTMLTRNQPHDSREAGADFIHNLSHLGDAVEGAVSASSARLREGFLPPLHSMLRTLASVDAMCVDGPDNALRKICNALPEAMRKSAHHAVVDAALPALVRLRDAVRDAVRAARGDQGLGSAPNGQDHYAWLLRAHTTTDLTPDAVHTLGQQETARLHQALHEALDTLAVDAGALAERLRKLEPQQPRFGHDRDVALQEASALMHAYEDRARPLFNLWPNASFTVAPVPTALEGALMHHYAPPVADGARPGSVMLNALHLIGAQRASFSVQAAHEAAPGHHTQLTVARELAHLSAFRRTIVFNAYIEGWAKYAETLLVTELDCDPYVHIAQLQGELYSSVNLALDTGIHALGWTRAYAIAHFMENTGASSELAAAIVDRSFVTPGQLCSYKIGMLRMLALRERMREHQGSRFEIRDFHDAVLGCGALPLNLLDRLIDARATETA